MITIGVCFVYYGIALFLYQVYGWWDDGRWTAYTVLRAWHVAFDAPMPTDAALVGPLVAWIATWPFSLMLLLFGAGLIGSVFAQRALVARWKARRDRRWLAAECNELGYQKWTIPHVVAELENQRRKGAPVGKKPDPAKSI
jgi:hypothetical protein